MEKNSWLSEVLAGLIPEGNIQLVYEPSKNFLLQTLLQDNSGNKNKLNFISNKSGKGLEQRITTNDSRNYN